jgi:hypothetical protein
MSTDGKTYAHHRYQWYEQIIADGLHDHVGIAHMIAKNDFCVTYEQLARGLKVSLSTAERLVRKLLKHGHLKVESGKAGRVTNRYKPVLFNHVKNDGVEDEVTPSEMTWLEDQPRQICRDNPVKSDVPTPSNLTNLSPKSLSQESPKRDLNDRYVPKDSTGALSKKAQPYLEGLEHNQTILPEEESHNHAGSLSPRGSQIQSSTGGTPAAPDVSWWIDYIENFQGTFSELLDWWRSKARYRAMLTLEKQTEMQKIYLAKFNRLNSEPILPEEESHEPEIDYGEVDPDWAKRNPEGWDGETP